ncbi:MAG: SPOR domain-containing protein [Rhizobacter sp.]|nr:SPOR domain-containing protein [Rhizobacter sp.]
MLRFLVAALLLANLAFYAWTQAWLDDVVGVRAQGDREPERLSRQVRPELVQIRQPSPKAQPAQASAPAVVVAAASTPAPQPSAAPVCLEAGPFSTSEVGAAEAALKAALPAGSWVSQKIGKPGLWMVYLGRFPDRDALHRRQDELRAIKVDTDELRSPPDLAPGLSLGRFEERNNASNALEKLTLRGIRGAKIVEVRSPSSGFVLRVEQATPAQAAELAALGTPALASKGFSPCAK